METGNYVEAESVRSRWDQLPPPVLNQIADLVPYKKGALAAVCQTWRRGIIAGLRRAALRDANLRILQHLRAVQYLTFGPFDNDIDTYPLALEPEQAPTARPAIKSGNASASSNSSTDGMCNLWSLADTDMMNRLRTLSILASGGPIFQQLADWLTHPSNCNSSCSRPSLYNLQELQLSQLGDISEALHRLRCVARQGDTPAQQDGLPCAHIQGAEAVGVCYPLQHLGVVNINDCAFRAAPECFYVLKELPSLRTLRIVGCNLQQFPPAVPNCSKLTLLDLTRNRLQELPGEISKLQDLQSLKLTGNYDLHTLGDGLSHLTSLTHLDLCECAAIYGGHPDQAAVVRSTAVNHHGAPQSGSDMSHTLQLLQLPQLAALTNMLRLNLSHNHSLCMLPASISHLTRLTELDVTNCSIRFINDELWACQSLKRLTMACNLMPKLSDNISRLVDLEDLDLGGNKSLWELTPALLSLKALTRLVINPFSYDQYLVEVLMVRGVEVDQEQEPYEDEMDFL